MPRLTGRQVVAIVLAICCAVVLQPVASTAAGTLMTMVDRSDSTRQSRVTSNGAVAAETRPGAHAAAFTYSSSTTGFNYVLPVTETGPTNLAITNVVLTAAGNGHVRVSVVALNRASGSQVCSHLAAGTAPSGWGLTTFATFMIPANESVALPLSQPWTASSASGQPVCVGYRVQAGGANAATSFTVNVSLTGYRFLR